MNSLASNAFEVRMNSLASNAFEARMHSGFAKPQAILGLLVVLLLCPICPPPPPHSQRHPPCRLEELKSIIFPALFLALFTTKNTFMILEIPIIP